MREFLREAAGKRFQLGTHDCGLLLADWIMRVTRNDPAAPIRGAYRDEESLMALAGLLGLPRLFDRLLRGGGMIRTDDPQLGDVVMIIIGEDRPRGAIRTDTGFVTIAEHGLWGVRGEVRMIAAWTFP